MTQAGPISSEEAAEILRLVQNIVKKYILFRIYLGRHGHLKLSRK